MKVTAIRSDEIYRKIVDSSKEKREDIYRYELMKPFEFKWKCIGIPLKVDNIIGYDVVSISVMNGGYKISEIDKNNIVEIDKISDDGFWKACKTSILNTLENFENHGIMLPVALAHEANHNVRWQFMQWNSNLTLGDMIVSEGLAENFATLMFGEDKVGMWVKKTSIDILENTIKPTIKANIYEKDFNKISAYLYGDEIVSMHGLKAVGMPYCGGYACGYELIKYYLEKTGKNIYEATITSTKEILRETEDFWN